MTEKDKAKQIIEQGVGEIYRGFFRLRELQEYQEEYISMHTIMHMIMKDLQHLREKYNVKP
jgi:hypothetical protein